MGYRVVRVSLGWVVRNRNGETVSPVLPSEDRAVSWSASALERRRPKKRACIRCRGEFYSDGIHDRLCPRCGTTANDAGLVQAGMVPASPRSGQRRSS